MALATLGGLKAAVATWMERGGDTAVTGNAGDIVTLAEARLNLDLAGIRTTRASATLTGTAGSRALTLPAGYLSPLELFLTTFGDEQRLRAGLTTEERFSTQGVPAAWAAGETTLELDCLCDQAHTFRFAFLKGLSLAAGADGDSNWLLLTYPNAYLFASIIEAVTMLGDAETVAGYEMRLQPLLTRIRINEGQNLRRDTARVDAALTPAGGYDIRTDR